MFIVPEDHKKIVVVFKFMKNYSQKFTGFTLIELLLYVAIAGTSMILISLFLTTLLSSRVKSETISEVEYQGLQAINFITQKVRNAESVNFPVQGSSGNILNLSNGEFLFFVENETLFLEKEGAVFNLTNERVLVKDILFENVGRANTPDIIRISFLLSYNNPLDRIEYSYERFFITSASLRSYQE